jgi:hypothetical protein
MQDRVNAFFDLIKLIARRLPDLSELLVQMVLLGLLVLGALALFKGHL